MRFDPAGSYELMADDDLSTEMVALNVDHDDFELLRAAILLGRVDGRPIDVEATEAKVNELVDDIRVRLADDGPRKDPLEVFLKVMFEEHGFEGDVKDYDSPLNSFLHHVIERRRGLPISLGVLTCHIARAAGIDAYEIAFPGHFLVGIRHTAPDGSHELIVIDPFYRGRMRSHRDLETHLGRLARREIKLGPEHLAPAPPDIVLMRMLNNLRASFLRRRDPVRLTRVLSRLLLLRPGSADLLVERAICRREILDDDGARTDAEEALRMADKSASKEAARQILRQLDDDARFLH